MSERIVKDMDFENHWSWQGVLDMLNVLAKDAADLSFAYREIGGWKLPTIEVRLDKPEELELPNTIEANYTEEDLWDEGSVIQADEIPDVPDDGNVWYMRKNGAAAVAYHAFKEALRVYGELGGQVEFVWSSIPLSPICDDARLTEARELACFEYGAIHTVWVHEDSDETLKSRMKEQAPCGELRVQNMTTANTWIKGQTCEDRLFEILGKGQIIE